VRQDRALYAVGWDPTPYGDAGYNRSYRQSESKAEQQHDREAISHLKAIGCD